MRGVPTLTFSLVADMGACMLHCIGVHGRAGSCAGFGSCFHLLAYVVAHGMQCMYLEYQNDVGQKRPGLKFV